MARLIKRHLHVETHAGLAQVGEYHSNLWFMIKPMLSNLSQKNQKPEILNNKPEALPNVGPRDADHVVR